MKVKRIDLYKFYKLDRKDNDGGYLDLYIPAVNKEFEKSRKLPFMLVIPGGGYWFLADREAEPLAFHYLANGFACGILYYSIDHKKYPTQLFESLLAMKYVKEHSRLLHIRKNRVAAIGCSAGGHLLGTLSSFTNKEKEELNVGELYRPDAAIFSYAVISSEEGFKHEGSFVNLGFTDKEKAKKVSIELRADKNFPISFIWASKLDDDVRYENSVVLANKLNELGIDNELYLLEEGGHGLSTCNLTSYRKKDYTDVIRRCTSWITKCDEWLFNHDFVPKE